MARKKSELNKSLMRLAKSSLIVFIVVIISKALTYAYRIIVARHYGPEAYGLLALSLMIFGWFAFFSKMGLGDGILRYVSIFRGKRESKKISCIVNFTLTLLFFTGIFLGSVLFLLSDLIAEKIFHNLELSLFLKIFAFILPISTLNVVFFALMKSYEKIGAFSFASKILENLVKLIILVVLIYLGIGSVNIPLSYLIGALITLLFSYLFCRISFKGIFKSESLKKHGTLYREVFSYSWPLIFFGFAVSILHQTDSFMLGIFKGVVEVGLYNAAIPIALLLTISVDLFNQLFFPLVTKEYSRGNKKLVKELSQQVGKWVYMISLPLFVLLIVFPGVFINLLFGKEYLLAENALRFLSVGAMFIAVFDVSKQLLAMKGKSKLILLDVLIIVILNVILNLILIPRYGMDGAAIATMISFLFLALIFAYQSWSHLKIVPLRKKMFKITLVAFILLGFLVFFKQIIEINTFSLIISGVLFIGMYIALLFIFGCLDENDNLVVSLIKRKLSVSKVPSPEEKDL